MLSFFRASLEKPYGYWLPVNISRHGAEIDHLINLLHIFIVVFFVGWLAYFAYVLFRFRAKAKAEARAHATHRRFRFPLWIEVGVAGFEIFLLACVSSPLWWKIKSIPRDDARAIHLRVVAQQFQWLFHYPGADGRFGKTRPELVNEGNFLGLDRSDSTAKDDIVSLNHLHIPVNRPIVLKLSSKDVIHSFFIPVLRVKQDVVPGMPVTVWFEATALGQDFEIACAQLCGVGHTNMRGFLHIDSEGDYHRWLTEEAQEVKLGAAR